QRMVAHLLQVDADLGKAVATGLALETIPAPAKPAREPNRSLKPSPALSILRNPPKSFAGRKAGVLLSDGAPAGLLAALRSTLQDAGATLEIIAPAVGGVEADDGSLIPADQQLA